MSKQKKKRNKAYTGADASIARPIITRLSAVKRNRMQQWWFDNKRIAKPVGITGVVVIIIVWLLFELIRALSGSGA